MVKYILLFLLGISSLFSIDFDALEHKKVGHKAIKLDVDDANRVTTKEYNKIVQKHRQAIGKFMQNNSSLSRSQRSLCLGSWNKDFCYDSSLSRSQRSSCLGSWNKDFCYDSSLNKAQRNMCIGKWNKDFCYSSSLNNSQRKICLGKWDKSFCY
jgi:hypothetical protein